jgi:hypothetical protein
MNSPDAPRQTKTDNTMPSVRLDPGKQTNGTARLDHEVPDASVEDRAGVVARLCQDEEVFACARRDVAVQLQVEVAQAGVQPHVALLLRRAFHPHLEALVDRHRRNGCRREGPRSRACSQTDGQNAFRARRRENGPAAPLPQTATPEDTRPPIPPSVCQLLPHVALPARHSVPICPAFCVCPQRIQSSVPHHSAPCCPASILCLSIHGASIQQSAIAPRQSICLSVSVCLPACLLGMLCLTICPPCAHSCIITLPVCPSAHPWYGRSAPPWPSSCTAQARVGRWAPAPQEPPPPPACPWTYGRAATAAGRGHPCPTSTCPA